MPSRVDEPASHFDKLRATSVAALLWMGAAQAQAFQLEAYADTCDPSASPPSLVTSTFSAAKVDSGAAFGPIDPTANDRDWACRSWAEADLTAARLRTYAFSSTIESGLAPDPGGGYSMGATARLADTLTFVGPPHAPPFPPAIATLTLTISGGFTGDQGSFFHYTDIELHDAKSFASGYAHAGFSWTGPAGPNGTPAATIESFGASAVSLDPANLHVTLTATLPVVSGNTVTLLLEDQSKAGVGPHGSAAVDFGHSATLTVVPPSGWSFTSGSGLLASAVDEPPPAVLLLAGAVLWAGRRLRGRAAARRRRHAFAPPARDCELCRRPGSPQRRSSPWTRPRSEVRQSPRSDGIRNARHRS